MTDTAETTLSPEAAPAGLLPLTDPRLREAVTREVAARRPLPVARNTLALMADSALLDHGLRADASDEGIAVAVRGIVDDLAARHPALFAAEGAEATPVASPAGPARAGIPTRATATPARLPARDASPRTKAPPKARVPRGPITVGGWPLRDALLAAGAVVALLAIGFVLVSPSPARGPDPAAKPASHGTARPDVSQTGTVAAAGPIEGPAEVAGPAALRIDGRLVRLFGVEAGTGGAGGDLAAYLAGRPVACRPVGAGTSHECAVEGRDISEVVLFNGGAKAAADATPALVAAEDHARAQRLGVWRR